MKTFIERRVKAGINVVALSPETPLSNHDPAIDRQWLYTRTWLPEGSYNAPVEIDVYGNKVALLSFENEAIGTVIQSPQIADAMRQLFDLLASNLAQNQ